jgi:tetratricopeptide (TPR) repeat protein
MRAAPVVRRSIVLAASLAALAGRESAAQSPRSVVATTTPSPAALLRACRQLRAAPMRPLQIPRWVLRHEPPPRSPPPYHSPDVAAREVGMLRTLANQSAPTEPHRADILARLAATLVDIGERAAVRGDAARAAAARREAVQVITTLAADHPTFARLDAMLFRMGLAYSDDNDMTRARQSFLRVVRDYPMSVEVPYVYLQFAEYYFTAQQDMAAARPFYDRAARFAEPTTLLWAVAQYRLGEIAWNLADAAAARQHFARVVQFASGQPAAAAAMPDLDAAARRAICGP